ncbi:DUF488 domain-containing protein [Fodinicola acaciae]|uniref:DUF488 domain-containing protein n=1 Tax=Fodinicola acaciae TaxID=2681555 RepID=UPI0013D8ADD2|nr:DUF488 family protein [Fodinicola acaciae]
MEIRVGRVYDEPSKDDGRRVLVDRLWPRGLRKDSGHFDKWAKEVAPSAELRKWYAHDPSRKAEFADRYRAELAGNPECHRLLEESGDRLTLLTATKDVDSSHAVVLADFLRTLT